MRLNNMTDNEICEFDPIQDWIGKITQLRHNDRQYAAKLIAIRDNELWFEGRNKQRWMVNRSELQYIGLVGNQVA
jgi:hypothetical protein